jgi:hypothetical protein
VLNHLKYHILLCITHIVSPKIPYITVYNTPLNHLKYHILLCITHTESPKIPYITVYNTDVIQCVLYTVIYGILGDSVCVMYGFLGDSVCYTQQ